MHSSRLWSKNFVLINLCVIFASFTNYAYIYILPVHMLGIGGSNTDVGLMGTGLTLVGLITRLTLAPLIDKWGRKNMLVLGVCLFAVNSLGYLMLRDSVGGVILMRCVSGFSQGIFFPVPPTIVSDVVSEDKLVDGLGIFGIAGSLPAVFSPVVGMYLYENVSPASFFVLTLAMSAISIVFALLYQDEYKPQPALQPTQKRRFSLNSVLEVSILLPCLIAFLAMAGNSAVNNFVINFGNTRAIAGMSLFFTVNNIASVLTRMFAGRLTKWLSSGKLVTLGMIVLGVGNLIVVFAMNLPVMLAASVLIGIGMTLYSQLLQADILRQVDESRRGVANSTLMLAQDLGTGAGASAFGVTSEYMGYPITFIFSAVVTWLGLPVCMKTYRKKKSA